MSELADQERNVRRVWARPDGGHDRLIRAARAVLPMCIGALAAFLIFAPLSNANGDVSFVLAKDSVDIAKERMKVIAATYRGEDSKGRPFKLTAGSAVQQSSKDPVVRLNDLAAEIQMKDGPAALSARKGRYDMSREVVLIDGPLTFTSTDGYRLATSDVAVGLKSRRLVSSGAASGTIPLGSFSAGQLRVDLEDRTVTLAGRAHLHITQGIGR
jgi:lipopolysaccharide export system protein LptC